MAQYGITHSCGHTATHQIYGTNSHGERERKAAWLKNQDCSECWKATQAAEIATANAALPTLTGSEKQVSWAHKIRAEFVAGVESLIATVPASQQATAREQAEPLTAKVLTRIDAKWWIDHRSESPRQMLAAASRNA